MSKLQIQLHRNLRRTVLRGHPWIYRDAVAGNPKVAQAQLCQLNDVKNEFLAWAYYDPHSPLCLRILSLDKKPPTFETYESRFALALEIRRAVLSADTNSYRLFNGEGDLLPGLVCDVYDKVAVLQFDGQGSNEFWDKKRIADWLIKENVVTTVIEKLRRHTEGGIILLAGVPCENEVVATEHGVKFLVNLEKGQKTGFFLDQRENRNYIRSVSKGKSVLNLFSYSGGFSVYAGLGGAVKVASLDIAEGAIDLATQNWALNGLNPEKHTGLCVDVFEYLNSPHDAWDHIIVDPPSMGHSEEHRDRAKTKYIELFAAVAKKVKPGGQLSVSSCSSHVSFSDFNEIIEESLSQAKRRGRILRVSGQGPDHPFPHSAHELRYLKFVHIVLN
ncbi:MAG: class I SAM-dependent rRNA methyltransferase [Bdellovibrio sp.]|nr:class I SAM-dependent rRNA methyltransferase [Bdellovibrio sp.]